MCDYKLSLAVLYIALALTPIVNAASCQHFKRIERSPEADDDYAETDTNAGGGMDTSETLEEQGRSRTEELEKQQLRLEYIKQQILAKLGMSEAPKVRRKPMEVEAYMHLMGEVQRSRSKASASESHSNNGMRSNRRNNGINNNNGANNGGVRRRTPGDQDDDSLFVLPVLTTSNSATFNLTLNPQSTLNNPVKKITLFLQQKTDVVVMSDLEITIAASSWALTNEPLVFGTVEPDEIPESFENNLQEPVLQWIEYDLTSLLGDDEQFELLNMLVVRSRWLKIAFAYLRIDFEDV